jgi:hypothetical protein
MYSILKNKKIYDINSLEELNWIKKNSHINNYVYVGQRVIIDKAYNVTQLKSIFSIFKEIDESFLLLKNEFGYENMNQVVEIIQKSYITFFDNVDFFINNPQLIEEFISMYHIIRYIEIEYFIKKRVRGVRGVLWDSPIVRDPFSDMNRNNPQLFRRAIPLAENGDYKKALELLTLENLDKIYKEHNIPNSKTAQISLLFYRHKFQAKLGINSTETLNELEALIENSEFWTLTHLKIAEFYLENYIHNKDKYSLDKYFLYFKKSLASFKDDNKVQFMDTVENYSSGAWNVGKSNPEIFREPILNIGFYYYSCVEEN